MPIEAAANPLDSVAKSRSFSIPPERKVLGGFGVIMMLSGGALWASTLGIFLKPLENELGWSQTQIYLGVTICYLMTPFFALLVGWLLDRGHARRVIIVSILLEGLVFFGMSRMGHGIAIYYVLCILMFGTGLGVTPVPLTKVINSWFVDRRGMALGVLFSLNYAGAMVAPIAALSMIGHLGWRHTYAAFGVLVLVLALGAALAWVRVKPDQSQPATKIATPKPAGGQRGALMAAIRQREFPIVAVWLVLYGYSFNSISFHLVPMLEEYGLSTANAAIAQGLVGLGGLGGNLLAGVLLDRVHASRLATIFALFPLAGLVMLAVWPGQASGYVMAASLGLAVGSEGTILMYLGGRLFAPAILGTVMALLLIVVTIGAASGPVVAALLHDHFGSYHSLLVLNGLTFFLSALMPLGLKNYRY